MESMIACCGIKCDECGAYIATQNNDDAKRKEIAAEWSQQFGHEMSPKDINCDGCPADGRHIGYCEICEIRKCAREKDVVNCAYCDAYICEKLGKFYEMAPAIKANLEGIRRRLNK